MKDITKQNDQLTLLPASLTSLVGRESEQEAVCALLARPGVRLLTITGTGGIGKTRLALAVAHELVPRYADGVIFVPLAPVSDPDLVLSTIIQVLDLKETTSASLLTTLKIFLQEKHVLLLLDNFEQVIDAAPLLLDLLQECSQLSLLITSRQVLHLAGEFNYLLAPLELPDLQDLPNRDVLERCASVTLFVQRARMVRPDFRLTDDNKQVVAEICNRLDGLPLALELAAARMKLLSSQALLTRLSSRLDLLSTPDRAVHQRQQTVRKTIQWSYDLLSPFEQRLFQRLSVFVGGCALEDVEALYALLGEESGDVLDGISSLVDKSLVFSLAEGNEDQRLTLLETIREFGLECLQASGDLERVRQAHAQNCLTLLEKVEPFLFFLPFSTGMEPIKREYRNLQAALHFLWEQQQMEGTLRIAAVLGAVGLWFLGGYLSEAQDYLERTLAASKVAQLPGLARVEGVAMFVVGWIDMWLNQYEQALVWFDASATHFRALEEAQALMIVFNVMSFSHYELGSYQRGEEIYGEGMSLARRMEDKVSILRYLVGRVLEVFHRGEFESAHLLAHESLILATELDDMFLRAYSLHFVGWTAYCLGNYSEARTASEESVALFRAMKYPICSCEAMTALAYIAVVSGDEKGADEILQEVLIVSKAGGETADTARALCEQGRMALRQGDLVIAQKLYEEALHLMARLKYISRRHRYIPACCLEGLAELAAAQQQEAWAARLLGAADALRVHQPYYNPLGKEQNAVEQAKKIARTVLGANDFNQAFAEGKSLTLPQALVAQNPVTRSRVASAQARTSRRRRTASVVLSEDDEEKPPIKKLTKRELEVLYWLAEGLKNMEIANRMTLSIVTINSYLRSIYNKLGVSSRTRAIYTAREYHLV